MADVEPNRSHATDDDEKLPCSWRYITVCILLSSLNGLNFAFMWPGYSLHFTDMGWSLITAGIAVTVGYIVRMTTQQINLWCGYWSMVPLALIHETFAVLALVYWNQEWAVFAQIVVGMGIDSTCAIEGICFDSFGDSESLARKASATCLSVFTVASALGCLLGGIVYDLAGWPGVCTYHTVVEGLLLLLVVLDPAVHMSFRAVFFRNPDEKAEEEKSLAWVIPAPSHLSTSSSNLERSLPGSIPELRVTEVEDVDEPVMVDRSSARSSMREAPSVRAQNSVVSARLSAASARLSARSRNSAQSARSSGPSTVESVRSTQSSGGSRGSGSVLQSAWEERRTENSHGSTAARRLVIRTSRNTQNSASTRRSSASTPSLMASAGRNIHLHPQIVGATGATSVMRENLMSIDADGQVIQDETATRTTTIPKHVRCPAFLVVLSCLCNTGSYAIEFATFAIYFKQVHNWNDAAMASLAQTMGDVLGAIVMQLVPYFFSNDYDPDMLGCFRRNLHYLISSPYNLSVALGTWTMFNLGMMSPVLPIAVAAQIFMGTSYVYCCKWATEMNLFYSLGDAEVFLTLQVYCKNAEAFGGAIGGLLAVWLFTLDPIAPFGFSSALAGIVWITYTVGFCVRLGFGSDIETSEEKRSRRFGVRRVSSWQSDLHKSPRKSQE